MACNKTKLLYMVEIGLEWSKIIQNGPKWSNMVYCDLIFNNMVQTLFTKSSKWVRHNQVPCTQCTVAPTNPFCSMGKPSFQNTSKKTKKNRLRIILVHEANFVYLMHYLLQARDIMGNIFPLLTNFDPPFSFRLRPLHRCPCKDILTFLLWHQLGSY